MTPTPDVTTADKNRSVVWKVVITDPLGQEFTVPRSARFVSVGVDPAGQGMAVWFRWSMPDPGYTGPNYTTTWRLGFAGTGHPFPSSAKTLGTVVTGHFAFHVLDLDGEVTR